MKFQNVLYNTRDIHSKISTSVPALPILKPILVDYLSRRHLLFKTR